MATYRQLHCRMWSSDNWFIELKPDLKLLFIYLFSNERTTMTGLYEINIRTISFETGLDRETVTRGLEVFNKADKIKYDFEAGVVWVKNAMKYQIQTNPNDKVLTRIKADIDAVPNCALKRECIDTLSIRYGQGIDTTVSVSSKVSVSSEERGGVGEKTKKLFSGYFGRFTSPNESARWSVLFEAVGEKQADELAAWAFKKEIHLTNRASLLDSLETAAKNWKGNGSNGSKSDGVAMSERWLAKKEQELHHGRS